MTAGVGSSRHFRRISLQDIMLALSAVLAVATWFIAASIVVDTLRTVWPLVSPLPWFDDWGTLWQFRSWITGERGLWDILVSQNNEHRILVPRLVFLADDLWFGARGRVAVATTFSIEALHAAMLIRLLARSRPLRHERWAVAALIVACLFSLRQAENFLSGFQLQFVGVFAGATLTFVLFSNAVARAEAGRAMWPLLAASLASALMTAFTMANGVISAVVLVALALAARLRPAVVSICVAWAVLVAAVYLHGYEPVGHHESPLDALRHPLEALLYVAAYLGSLLAETPQGPVLALGMLGIAATMAAVVRSALAPPRPADLALVGVMVFVGATAALTALGRFENGLEQAVSSRYVTGSAVFWAAQLAYWWSASCASGTSRARTEVARRCGVAAVALMLVAALAAGQGSAKPTLYVQAFRENEAGNLLLLGLHDPETLAHVTWEPDWVESLAPFMKARRLSIFGTSEADLVGRPIAPLGPLAAASACSGGILSADAAPALGTDAVRVRGTALGRAGAVRRIVLTDLQGLVVGLASGGVPGARPHDWRGFARAPIGDVLSAFAVLKDGALCRLGAMSVSASAEPADRGQARP